MSRYAMLILSGLLCGAALAYMLLEAALHMGAH